MSTFLRKIARLGAHWSVVCLAVLAITAWALAGPLFHFSDTWQRTLNLGITLAAFLMIVVIQSTQSRNAQAFRLKLDEVQRALTDAGGGGCADLEDPGEVQLKAAREKLLDECRVCGFTEEQTLDSAAAGHRIHPSAELKNGRVTRIQD